MLASVAIRRCARGCDFVHDANPDLLWLNERSHDLGDWLHIDAGDRQGSDRDRVLRPERAARPPAPRRCSGTPRTRRSCTRWPTAISAAFQRRVPDADGALKSGTQTAYALALRFGLVPDGLERAAVAHLVEDIERRGTHISTGFLGVAHLLPALSDGGRSDVAYRLLQQDTFPSWLYAVDARGDHGVGALGRLDGRARIPGSRP